MEEKTQGISIDEEAIRHLPGLHDTFADGDIVEPRPTLELRTELPPPPYFGHLEEGEFFDGA